MRLALIALGIFKRGCDTPVDSVRTLKWTPFTTYSLKTVHFVYSMQTRTEFLAGQSGHARKLFRVLCEAPLYENIYSAGEIALYIQRRWL